MRKWSWHKGALWVDDILVADFQDLWEALGDSGSEPIIEFIVDACNAQERLKDMQGKMEKWSPKIESITYGGKPV